VKNFQKDSYEVVFRKINARVRPMRKAAHFMCFLAPCGANFAYDGAVPASQD
jgi:hypothetical protein